MNSTSSLKTKQDSSAERPQRTRRSPQRFHEETKYLHPSFGGAAGANNEHTAGRKIDDGHSAYIDYIGSEHPLNCTDNKTITTMVKPSFAMTQNVIL